MSQGILRWVEQSRINRLPIAVFIDFELIWFIRLWTLFRSFFAIGCHYWTQLPDKPGYKSENNKLKCVYNNILISVLTIVRLSYCTTVLVSIANGSQINRDVGFYMLINIIYMSDCENPRFTERTSTNLGRSHRLPHICTIMIYGKLGGYRLQETAAFIYIYIHMWWTMNNMWYLGIANVDIREIWWHNLEKGYR